MRRLRRLGPVAAIGALFTLVAIVVGLIPTEGPDGRDCGSVLGPGRHSSQVCDQARTNWLPYVLVPLGIGAILLIIAFAVWWRRLGEAAGG